MTIVLSTYYSFSKMIHVGRGVKTVHMVYGCSHSKDIIVKQQGTEFKGWIKRRRLKLSEPFC